MQALLLIAAFILICTIVFFISWRLGMKERLATMLFASVILMSLCIVWLIPSLIGRENSMIVSMAYTWELCFMPISLLLLLLFFLFSMIKIAKRKNT